MAAENGELARKQAWPERADLVDAVREEEVQWREKEREIRERKKEMEGGVSRREVKEVGERTGKTRLAGEEKETGEWNFQTFV